MVDRDFIIMSWLSIGYAEINAETLQQVLIDDIIPVDYRIKAIHRIYAITDAFSHSFIMTDTFQPHAYSEEPTVDGSTLLYQLGSMVRSEEAVAIYLPSDVDVEMSCFTSTSPDDTMMYISKFQRFVIESTEIAKWEIGLENLGNTLTTGTLLVINLLECEVL